MTIKIDAPSTRFAGPSSKFRERLVRESDYRKLMAVVRAADEEIDDSGDQLWDNMVHTGEALIVLRKHLAKRK